jgi:hypothetical protein
LSSEGQELKTKKESLVEYEKGYLERMEREKKQPDGLQNLIFQMSQEFKELEKKEYIGFCAFCTMGVERVEMVYKNNLLFHPNCYDQQGKNFPAVDQEILYQTSNTKVQLVLLKNLKVRTMGASNIDSTKTKTKKKSKGKTKKRRPKRRVAKRKRTTTKRRTSKRKPSKKRRVTKRRTVSKRKKTARKTKRRATRTTKRKARRRR